MATAIERLVFGNERVPIVVIDDAHPTPDTLRATALELSFRRTGDDFYPGVRADAPADYIEWLNMLAGAVWPGPGVAVIRAAFAIANDRAADLAPIQRVPHFDTVDGQVVAAVHYLCEPPHDGTSFFRHRRTGYERIDRSRQSAWRQALNRDVREYGRPGADDLPGDAAAFERTGSVALRFNRLILYPANCLHAGDLVASGSAKLASYRLTLTSLLTVETCSLR